MRIGHGYDVHKLEEGRKLIIGGIEIPFKKGLVGHSDADVLLHAIMDSIIGAMALGDIGKHFPDNDNNYKDIDSKELLRQIIFLMNEHGYKIGNIDSTIIAQQPKLSTYIEEMRKTIANIMEINLSQVNIKATTEEGLGFTGIGEGISAHAVCLSLIHI